MLRLNNLLLIVITAIGIVSCTTNIEEVDCSFRIPNCNPNESVYITGQKYNECPLDYVCGDKSIPKIIEVTQATDYYKVIADGGGKSATSERGYMVKYRYEEAKSDKEFNSLNNTLSKEEYLEFIGGHIGDYVRKDRDGTWYIPLPRNLHYNRTWVYILLECVDSAKCNFSTSHVYRTIYVNESLKNVRCIDSDGGKNSTVKGVTVGYLDQAGVGYASGELYNEFVDYCDANRTVWEFYCREKNGLVFYTSIECQNGCNDGACIK